ncbi:MAG: sarcosine oxidase subunit delta [Gammaproteobacteria bacterium]
MKHFDCPLIGRRPVSEFLCAGGAIHGLLQEDAAAARHGVYFGDATARVKREWWFHRPSHLWFVIARDTATDEVTQVALASRAGNADDA